MKNRYMGVKNTTIRISSEFDLFFVQTAVIGYVAVVANDRQHAVFFARKIKAGFAYTLETHQYGTIGSIRIVGKDTRLGGQSPDEFCRTGTCVSVMSHL